MAAPPHMAQDQPEHITFQLDADQDGVPEACFAHCAKRPMEAVFHHLQLSQDFMCSMETQAGPADHWGPDGMEDGDRPAAEMDLHRLQLLLDAHDDWQPTPVRESGQGRSCVAEPKNSAELDSSPTELRLLCLSDTVHHAATQSTNESSQPEVGKPSRHRFCCTVNSMQSSNMQLQACSPQHGQSSGRECQCVCRLRKIRP